MEKRGISFSNLYSFSCCRPYTADHARIGQRGYSRVVYCNEPDRPEAVQLNYKGNYVSTTKYTAVNFFPKSLFEQFRRVANVYFLVVAFVSFSPLAPYTAGSILAPLLVVTGATIAKEGVEDWRRRKQDIEANSRKIKIYGGNLSFHESKWKNLRVGDIVMVMKDEYFPADLCLLSSSYEHGICYVETMNLDGETNLKVKECLEETSSLREVKSFENFKAVIKCEDPNENLYSFVGSLEFNGSSYPLSPKHFLLRDSKLRNTDFIYGVVVFTGHDTKVMQNATDPPSKRSAIERKMDIIVYILFGSLILISTVGSIFFGVYTKKDKKNWNYRRWYLRPDHPSVLYDPDRALYTAIFHFFTGLMLYGYLIPISLYISIEVVKVLQSRFINQDQNMYYEETDKPAHARTSNLNEELGQVDTIMSDKTGTLTCNSMEFVKCSIAGIAYGRSMTEVELALASRKDVENQDSEVLNAVHPHGSDTSGLGKLIKGFNFQDERINDRQWISELNADYIQMFFRVLAICHTVIPDADGESGDISYEAESPDEAAFVIAAREIGFELFQRTQTFISLHELDRTAGKKIERSYQLLEVLEFSSARKRMSVIIRDPDNELLLLCKGADSVMFERLSEEGHIVERTKEHIINYAESGLRTLIVAYRSLVEDDFKKWQEDFMNVKASVSSDRDDLVDAVADRIERNLILLGATAVEDKLQKGVPECIDKLAEAGVKIWVLTGDKMETAINIGYACSLLRQGMRQIRITMESPEIDAFEKQGDKEALSKASFDHIRKQITEGKSQVDSTKDSAVPFGLIIDGKSLNLALDKSLEKSFLDLSINCSSVICCRSSPKQKALVTKLVKEGSGKKTLAIGDGANDVGMLQEADIGVGISGVEGMQAVMASDFAIAQFRFLERLLLVHGHWCYRRMAMMICYFFYKNITFGFTLFWFEAFASFSGRPAYNDWYMSFYNVFFTSLPVIALGVFDQDVSARLCMKYPELYKEGLQNILFRWTRILGWMLNGVISSMVIFYLVTTSVACQAFRRDGQMVDYGVLGVMMYTCIVWTVNCQMALSVNYFTWIQHFFIWGSIAFWYVFLVVYGALSPRFSTTAHRVLVEGTAPSFLYWLLTLIVVVSTLLPQFGYRAFQTWFQPMQHDIIQQKRIPGSKTDPHHYSK